MAPVKKGKSLTATPAATPPPPSLVEHLSFALSPRPWKDPNYRKNATRRNKTLKQILAGERIRARQAGTQKNGAATAVAMEPEASGSGEGNGAQAGEEAAQVRLKPGQKSSGQSKKAKAAEAAAGPVGIASEADYLAYMTIEAPPSVLPPKKYCDITGLEAPYIDPKSRLRYHNAEVYELLKTFGPGTDQSLLCDIAIEHQASGSKLPQRPAHCRLPSATTARFYKALQAMAQKRQLYRSLLRQYQRSSIQAPSERSPSITSHLRRLFDRPKDAAVLKPGEVENMRVFMKADRMHQDLVKRYNPGTDLTEPERIKATANRVGLNVPKPIDLNIPLEGIPIGGKAK